jgi:alpha-glucuronidase
MDRTVATGTGYTAQYAPPVAAQYESLARCPDQLLLFFHHVPYTHVLHSGQTVIQHIYDSHYAGAALAAGFAERWRTLRALVDGERYAAVLARLDYQAGHAIVWRDAICQWFAAMSGVADARGRVGHWPGRAEAESMRLEGYEKTAVTPWETASRGEAITCPTDRCTAAYSYPGPSGAYSLAVQYFDTNNGVAHYRLRVAGRLAGEWDANAALPSGKPDGHTSTRHLIRTITLRAHDRIELEARPGAGDRAAVDYLEVGPALTPDRRPQHSGRTSGAPFR